MKYKINDFAIDLKGREVKGRPWTSKEERAYLSNKGEDDSDYRTLKSLTQMLVLPNIEYVPMTLSELYYVILQLRKLSIGSEVSLNVTCSCGQKIEFDKDLDDLAHFAAPELENKKIKSEDVEITLRRIPTKELLLKVLSAENEEDLGFFEFLACIKSITYKGETDSTFTFQDLEEFFDSVPSKMFRDLYEEFFKLKGHIQLFCEVKCLVCGKVFDAVFRDLLSFLAP